MEPGSFLDYMLRDLTTDQVRFIIEKGPLVMFPVIMGFALGWSILPGVMRKDNFLTHIMIHILLYLVTSVMSWGLAGMIFVHIVQYAFVYGVFISAIHIKI